MGDEVRELVRSCLRGDQWAMRDLVERFQGQVFGLCYRMLGNRQDAEDAAQETFIRVLKNLSRWDATRDFEPWLLAIAGNRCRTALSARRRRASEPLVGIPSRNACRESQTAAHLAEEVERGLHRLRPDYRQAFVLFHQNQMPYEQIAETMSRPVGTIKTWIHRARRELMEYLIQREVIGEPCHAVRAV